MAREMAIAIACAGRAADLETTLRSLAGCRPPAAFRGLLVVENGPRHGIDKVVAAAAPWLRAEYLYVPEASKSRALNAALARLGHCLVVFSDDDVRFDAEVLRAYERAAKSVDGGRFFGGPLEVEREGEPPDWLLPYLPPSARGWRLPDDSPVRVTRPVFLGANWAAFSDDLREAGGFDPDFGPGSPTGATGQETNMQARLLGRGVDGLYVPDAIVRHRVPLTRCSSDWVAERYLRTGIRDGLSYRGPGRRVAGMPIWAMRDWLASVAALAALALAGNTRRFAARVRFLERHGFLRGSRRAHAEGRT